MSALVLFGTGSIARMAHHLFTHDSPHDVVACSVDRDHLDDGTVAGLPVVAFEEVATAYPPDQFGMFVAVGFRRVNRFRAARYAQAKAMGYDLVTYVSSRASIWPGVEIGDNTMVMDQVIVNPFVRIGNDTILWSGSHVGHESVVGDHCFISSHAAVSGFATIEDGAFLGTNCTIRDGITVARESVIGAGAVISRDTRQGGVYTAPQATLLPLASDRLPSL
ncbi:MAG: acetyltransferase [Chloroflexi bacterium]|nr:MAG: acetyltransferase [Chloroflexota bacterium]